MTHANTNNCLSASLTAKTPICLSGSLAAKNQKIQSLPPSCVISSSVWGQRAYTTNSRYPQRFALAAFAVSCLALWWAGISLWWQLLGTLFVGRYWWVWHQDHVGVKWLLLYPHLVVLSPYEGPLTHLPQPLTVVNVGFCCLLGRHVLWRDQLSEQHWRALLVLARWPLVTTRRGG